MNHNAHVRRLFRRLAALAAGLLLPAAAPAQVTIVPAPQAGTVVVQAQAVPAAPAADATAQVYVDDSFPAVDALRTAQRFESQHQSQLAIQKYQEVLDQYGPKLIAVSPDAYVSITDYVRARLLAMPSVQKGQYEQVIGPQARKVIEPLLAGRDPMLLLRACGRYFPATIAIKGQDQAAQWYFERGAFVTASRVWQQLLGHPLLTADQRALVLHHVALAEKLAGHDVPADEFRARLAAECPAATGTINGQSVVLRENLDTLLAQAAQVPWTQEGLAPDEWPMFQGSPSHSLVADVHSSAGAKLWWVNYAPAPDDQRAAGFSRGRIRVMGGGMLIVNGQAISGAGNEGTPEALASFPVLSGGLVFLHTGESVLAVSASAGTPLWKYPEKVARPEPNPYGYYGFAGRSVNHNACAVFGDQVFAVLPGGVTHEGSGRWYGPVVNNRLLALARARQADGKQVLWEKSGGEIARELEKDFPKMAQGSLTLVGSPVVTPQGLYVMARKFGGDAFTQLYLLHLDRLTGQTRWGCYLCSASTNTYYGNGPALGGIALPSIADDMVYVSTGQGADCAVDANAGRIVWLAVTESAKANRLQDNYTPPDVRAWRFNPPLISGDKLLTAEAGGKIRIYNRFTGKLLQAIAPKELGDASLACGIIGSTLYTIGTKICATDIEKGAAVWPPVDLNVAERGKVVGRPFLAARALYVSFEKGLLTLDLATGTPTNFSAWPVDDDQKPGKPGNLLVTREQIIVANDGELAGYSNWEAALANRQKDIRARPADPLAYLELAEIAFRTAHWDLAQQQMAQAVTLATAPGARANPDFLARLYNTNLNFGEQFLKKSEPALRDRARFYYECCQAAAHDDLTNAEWRMCLAALAVLQGNPAEAAGLYDAVLGNAALRAAPFRRNDTVTRAGVAAEIGMRAILKDAPRDTLYKVYEDRATAALAQAAAGPPNATAWQGLIDAYPNSRAALHAAVALADLYRQHNDAASQIKVLRWLYQRALVLDAAARPLAAQAAADLALAQAAGRHFGAALAWAQRGQRQFKDLTVQSHGQALSLHQLCDQLRQSLPPSGENRWPVLPEPVALQDATVIPLDPATLTAHNDAGDRLPIAEGKLLVPLETAANFRRPDVFFVTAAPGTVSMISAAALARTPVGHKPSPQWTIDLNKMMDPPRTTPQEFVLLGCVGRYAMFVCSDGAVSVNMDTGTRNCPRDFKMSDDEFARYAEQANRVRAIAAQQGQLGLVPGAAVFNGDDVGNAPLSALLNLDAEQFRTSQFNKALGRTRFTSLRLLGSRLVAVVGNKLNAYDIVSGKLLPGYPLTLPDGLPTAVVGNDDLLVVQVDSPERLTPTFVACDADTGNLRGSFKLDDEHVLWRGLAEDGTLYIVTDQAVTAYDLHGDLTQCLWKRRDLRQLRYAQASVLSSDGLVLINNSSELVCLPRDGDAGWEPQPIQKLLLSNGGWTGLRTAVDGENLIIRCTQGCVMHNLDTGKFVCDASFFPTPPPLVDAALADPYMVILAAGPDGTLQHSVSLFCLHRAKGLRQCLPPETGHLTRTPTDPEGPTIRAWQVVDNAILLDTGNLVTSAGTVNNAVFAYRPTPQAGK